MKTNRFLLAAGFALALVFTFSCSSDDENGGGSYSSSGSSSSANDGSSSSVQAGISYGVLSYEGKSYKTVKIENQTWMAENLNYDGGDGNLGLCYDDDEGNCEIYGRLYDWDDAMKVCPDNWHLPSNDEWSALVATLGGSLTAKTKLKAKNGWSNDNGTDNFGFSALPGGYSYLINDIPGSGYDFMHIGETSVWWSYTEYDVTDASAWLIGPYDDGVTKYDRDKTENLLSVRCIQ